MKTLDEVISRKDYSSINTELKKSCIEIAHKVRRKMQELEVGSIDKYFISEISANGNDATFLWVKDEEYDANYNLEIEFDEWFSGDYYHYMKAAKNRHRIDFLNDMSNILTTLTMIEDEKCKEFEKYVHSAHLINETYGFNTDTEKD